MNRTDLMKMGVEDEEIQSKILKEHNGEVRELKIRVKNLMPFEEALHSCHLGYSSDEVPTPETPTEAIIQLIQESQKQGAEVIQAVTGDLSIAIQLVSKWQHHLTLPVPVQAELQKATSAFLSQIEDKARAARENYKAQNATHKKGV